MNWTIDAAHSELSFKVRHMMITKVRGYFEQFSGDIELDNQIPEKTRVRVEIEAGSINTREPKRDAHLRSADFLDAENHPLLVFVSTRVERTGERTAVLHGDLTIRKITRPVRIDVTFTGAARSPWGTESVGFNGHTVINRKDWNLTWNQALETGGVLVGDEIEVDIELELVRQAETETAAQAAG